MNSCMKIDEPRRSNQCEFLLQHLKSGRTITQSEALDLYGIARLASRISDLRKRGFDIITKDKPVNSRFSGIVHVAEYAMPKSAKRCKRTARIGEYVEVTAKDIWGNGFEPGEIVQATEYDDYDGSVRCRNKAKWEEYYLLPEQYVVLEGFEAKE